MSCCQTIWKLQPKFCSLNVWRCNISYEPNTRFPSTLKSLRLYSAQTQRLRLIVISKHWWSENYTEVKAVLGSFLTNKKNLLFSHCVLVPSHPNSDNMAGTSFSPFSQVSFPHAHMPQSIVREIEKDFMEVESQNYYYYYETDRGHYYNLLYCWVLHKRLKPCFSLSNSLWTPSPLTPSSCPLWPPGSVFLHVTTYSQIALISLTDWAAFGSVVYFATIHPELGPSVCCLIDSVKDTPSSFTQLSFSNTCADVGSGSTLLLWSTLCLFYLFVTSFFFLLPLFFFWQAPTSLKPRGSWLRVASPSRLRKTWMTLPGKQ